MATKKGRSGDRVALLGGKRVTRLDEKPYAKLVHADHPGLTFVIEFDDRGEITRFEIERWNGPLPRPRLAEIADAWHGLPPQPFSAAAVRSIAFAELVAFARRRVLAPAQIAVAEMIDSPEALHWAKVFSDRPGRGGRSDLELATLARAYVGLLSDDQTIPTMAKRFHASEKTIKNQLTAARQRGLLTRPSKQGRKGGRLTKYAERVLADAQTKERHSGLR